MLCGRIEDIGLPGIFLLFLIIYIKKREPGIGYAKISSQNLTRIHANLGCALRVAAFEYQFEISEISTFRIANQNGRNVKFRRDLVTSTVLLRMASICFNIP